MWGMDFPCNTNANANAIRRTKEDTPPAGRTMPLRPTDRLLERLLGRLWAQLLTRPLVWLLKRLLARLSERLRLSLVVGWNSGKWSDVVI